jgi:hypothetical protein
MKIRIAPPIPPPKSRYRSDQPAAARGAIVASINITVLLSKARTTGHERK